MTPLYRGSTVNVFKFIEDSIVSHQQCHHHHIHSPWLESRAPCIPCKWIESFTSGSVSRVHRLNVCRPLATTTQFWHSQEKEDGTTESSIVNSFRFSVRWWALVEVDASSDARPTGPLVLAWHGSVLGPRVIVCLSVESSYSSFRLSVNNPVWKPYCS